MTRRKNDGDRSTLAYQLNSIAYCLSYLGRYDEALPRYKESVAMAERLDDSNAYRYKAELGRFYLRRMHDPKKAVPLLAEACDRLDELWRESRDMANGEDDKDGKQGHD